ncbi:MAG: TonB-dependent receptor domain-containing protein, partial [Flavobacteriales bacterium]
GFTLEGFYTRLNNAFYLEPIGADDFGELFEKRNGQGATVQGVTLELRANLNMKLQLESGLTLQTSRFDNKVEYIDGLEGIKDFIRTPNTYGYGILTLFPESKLNGVINYVYTGSMKVPHFAGAPNQTEDVIETSNPFHELSLKVNYEIPFKKLKTKVNFYGGIRNLTNSYQSNFDIGKNRDSNFVFGPAQPRTFYLGIKVLSL